MSEPVENCRRTTTRPISDALIMYTAAGDLTSRSCMKYLETKIVLLCDQL